MSKTLKWILYIILGLVALAVLGSEGYRGLGDGSTPGDSPAARQAMAEAERRLGPRGRLLVRYSGTEPKLRIMAEGEDQGLIDQVAQELAQALDIQLN